MQKDGPLDGRKCDKNNKDSQVTTKEMFKKASFEFFINSFRFQSSPN